VSWSLNSLTHDIVFYMGIGADRAELFKSGRTINLSRGEKLYSPMDECTSLGFVKSGHLGLSRILSSGKEILINSFIPGDLYAELIVFSGESYPGWLTALEDTTVVELDLKSLLQILQDQGILLSFLSGISQKVISLTNTIEILSQKTVKQKIAYYMLSLSDGYLNESITGLAARLGCSREALSRALSDLESDEILQKQGVHISIINEVELEGILFDD
jgi:CRP/FNR family transcriptional regulator, dissimilatory nitrate respiration regulator